MGPTLNEVVEIHKLRSGIDMVSISALVFNLLDFVWLVSLWWRLGNAYLLVVELLTLSFGVAFFIHLIIFN